jgi:hypothetical protein
MTTKSAQAWRRWRNGTEPVSSFVRMSLFFFVCLGVLGFVALLNVNGTNAPAEGDLERL